MLEDLYNLSFYKEIATLNEAHKIYLVQHIKTGRTFVKKEMTVYNKSVFEQLKSTPVPGIPKVFEVCEDDGILTIIEECISGVSLKDYVDNKGLLDESEVISIVSQLCVILDALHSFNPAIIHRDIKPSNIMITDDNRVVLIDLNGAKIENKNQSRDTELIGTQGFAAPEQYGFGASNIQTDIYSVGKLMLVLLTGEVDGSIGYKGSLKGAIDKCLNLDPKDRYESAMELKEALTKAPTKKSRKVKTSSVSIVAIIAITIITVVAYVTNTYTESEKATALSKNPALSDSEKETPNENEVIDQVLQDTGKRETPTNDFIESPIGAYKGDDGEILVIADDGNAYYYCYTESYTELECPWTLTDDTITISLAKMHCDIEASVENGCASLVFRSDSKNWNTEEFIWFTDDFSAYIKNPAPSVSENVTVLDNGDMQIKLDNLQFTIPKNFIDYGDEYSLLQYGINGYTFVDNDAANGFVASALICAVPAKGNVNLAENHKSLCKDFADNFMDNVQIGHTEPINIGELDGYSVVVSGMLNAGFSGLESAIFSGPIYIVFNEDYNDYIYLFFNQVVGEDVDDTALFEEIALSATPLN